MMSRLFDAEILENLQKLLSAVAQFSDPRKWPFLHTDPIFGLHQMRLDISFAQCIRELMDAWVSSCDDDDIDVILRAAKSFRANNLLCVVETTSGDLRDFVFRIVRPYDVNTELPRPDPYFLERELLPACRDAAELKRPSLAKIFSKTDHCHIAYERLVLPQKTTGPSRWYVCLLDIQFLLPRYSATSQIDDVDLNLLQLLRDGLSTKEIGSRIKLSPRTVEHRLERLKTKMQARSLTHLVALSIANGLENRAGNK
jgi:DNA-binding CsgD family transcriptional regulator